MAWLGPWKAVQEDHLPDWGVHHILEICYLFNKKVTIRRKHLLVSWYCILLYNVTDIKQCIEFIDFLLLDGVRWYCLCFVILLLEGVVGYARAGSSPAFGTIN